jgi:hypothetical protein
MFERRNLSEEVKSNQDKLDGCQGLHDFKPVPRPDNKIAFYRCSKCDGLVDGMSGLKYMLSGKFE